MIRRAIRRAAVVAAVTSIVVLAGGLPAALGGAPNASTTPKAPAAAPPPAENAKHEAACAVLKGTAYFAIGGVGFAGTTSEGETALRTLLDQPRVEALFEALLNDKNTSSAGKLYALLGLKLRGQLQQTRFEQHLRAFLASKANVPIMRGCLRSSEPVADVARGIRNGTYQIRNRPEPANARSGDA